MLDDSLNASWSPETACHGVHALGIAAAGWLCKARVGVPNASFTSHKPFLTCTRELGPSSSHVWWVQSQVAPKDTRNRPR